MNVLFLSFSNIFNRTGSVTRILTELDMLRQHDIEVNYLLFLPINQFINRSSVNNLRSQLKQKNVRLFIYPLITGNWLNRILFHFINIYTTIVLGIVSIRVRQDIIHAHTTRTAFMAFLFKKYFNVPYVFDMHGAAVEELEERSYPDKLKKRLTERVKYQEKMALENSNLLICVSNRMKEIVLKKYPHKTSGILVMPCLADIKRFYYSHSERNRIREELEIADKTVIVYSGSTADYQCVEKMCSLFSFINKHIDKLLFLILSNDNIQYLLSSLRKYGITQERYIIKQVKYEDMHRFLCASDAGLLIRKNLYLNNVASPTKLGEYLACGVPVISTPYAGDNEWLFKNNNIGYLSDLGVEWTEDLISFIKSVIKDRESWSRNCSDFVINHYSWQKKIHHLVEAYHELAGVKNTVYNKTGPALKLKPLKEDHQNSWQGPFGIQQQNTSLFQNC